MNDTQKTDFLFKKSLGVPFTNPGAPPYTESDFEAYKRVIPSRQIYSQEIPATASLVSLGAATPVSGGGTKKVGTGTYSYIERYEDIPLPAVISGLSYRNTLMVDAIPPLYDTGLSYAITVKLNGSTIPQSSTDHPWFFDSDAGILIFTNGANTAERDNKLTASFWRYAGTKGLGSGGGGGGGGVGDASDGQLLYNKGGSVSGSEITYAIEASGAIINQYSSASPSTNRTALLVTTKTVNGTPRYLVTRHESIQTQSGSIYDINTDLASQPFIDLTVNASNKIVSDVHVHNGISHVTLAIGLRIAISTNNGSSWVTYTSPNSENFVYSAYGDSIIMLITDALRQISFTPGTPGTFGSLSDFSSRDQLQLQNNIPSGLYYIEIPRPIKLSYVTPTFYYPCIIDRMFIVTYIRSTPKVTSQINLSIIRVTPTVYRYNEYNNESVVYNFMDSYKNYSGPLLIGGIDAPYGINRLILNASVHSVPIGLTAFFFEGWNINYVYRTLYIPKLLLFKNKVTSISSNIFITPRFNLDYWITPPSSGSYGTTYYFFNIITYTQAEDYSGPISLAIVDIVNSYQLNTNFYSTILYIYNNSSIHQVTFYSYDFFTLEINITPGYIPNPAISGIKNIVYFPSEVDGEILYSNLNELKECLLSNYPNNTYVKELTGYASIEGVVFIEKSSGFKTLTVPTNTQGLVYLSKFTKTFNYIDGVAQSAQYAETPVINILDNGYVGIGTTDPQRSLDVSGGIISRGDVDIYPASNGVNGIQGNGVLRVRSTDANGNTRWGSMYLLGSDKRLIFDTNANAAQIELQSSGVVVNATGATTGYKFEVTGTSKLLTTDVFSGGWGSGIRLGTTDTSANSTDGYWIQRGNGIVRDYIFITAPIAASPGNTNGVGVFIQGWGQPAPLFTARTDLQRVGIGTSAPLDRLDVNGTLRIQDRNQLPAYNGTGNTLYPGVINLAGDYGPQIRSIYPNMAYTNYISLQFLTSQGTNTPNDHIPRMHIEAQSGNVGINTTTPLSHAKTQIHMDIPTDTFRNNNPLPGQLILTTTNGTGNTERLILGATYTSGQIGAGYIQSSDFYNNQDNFTDLLLSPRGGRVGVGTLQTHRAMLNVGYGTNFENYTYSGQYISATSGYTNWQINYNGSDVSLYCFKAIIANNSIYVSSDERIKKDIRPIDDGNALQMLRMIEPATYSYIDVNHGASKMYGFIAQQVKTHFPAAVKIHKDTIPAFLQLCDATYNGTHMTLVDISNRAILADMKPNTLLKVIDISGREHNPPVISADASSGKIICDISGLNIARDISGGKMFLYGTDVDDFHTLDKDYLYAINFAATQEIDREVQRLRADNTALTNRVTALEARVAPLDNRVVALETQVSTLTGQNAALQQKLDALLSRLGITDL